MFIRLIKEPLIQFFLAGFVLYILYYAIEDESVTTQAIQQKPVMIAQGSIKNTATKLGVSQEDATKLVAYDTVLLHEAYFLQLFKQDKQIEKLLIKKMELLLNKKALHEPSEEELQKFFHKHKNEYGVIDAVDLYTLDLSDFSQEEQKQLVRKINLLQLDPKTTHLQQQHYSSATLNKEFGTYATHQLMQLFSHHWSQPIMTKDGVVSFYIQTKKSAQDKAFIDVEDRVYKDYMMLQTQEYIQQEYNKIKKHYEIVVK